MVELPADIREALARSRAADEPTADDQARVANALALHLGIPAATWSSPPPSAAKPAAWGAKLLAGIGAVGLATTLFVAAPALRNLGGRDASSTTSQLTAAGTTDTSELTRRSADPARASTTNAALPPSAARASGSDASSMAAREELDTSATSAPLSRAHHGSTREDHQPFVATASRVASGREASQPSAASASRFQARSAPTREALHPSTARSSAAHARSESAGEATPPSAAGDSQSSTRSTPTRGAPHLSTASAAESPARTTSTREATSPSAASTTTASFATRAARQPPIAAEAVNAHTSASDSHPQPATRDTRTPSAQTNEPRASSTYANSSSPPPSAAAPTHDSDLARELALVRGASRALDRSEPTTALRLLNQHARDFASGSLTGEREALRISALCQLGRSAEAGALRDELAADLAHSPLRARIERDCASD